MCAASSNILELAAAVFPVRPKQLTSSYCHLSHLRGSYLKTTYAASVACQNPILYKPPDEMLLCLYRSIVRTCHPTNPSPQRKARFTWEVLNVCSFLGECPHCPDQRILSVCRLLCLLQKFHTFVWFVFASKRRVEMRKEKQMMMPGQICRILRICC